VLREVTLQKYVELLGNYFGYLTHVAKVEPQWDDLFNRGRIGAFVRWHGKRHDRTLTAHAHQLVCKLAAMAKRLKRLEEARELAEYRQELGRPKPVRNERAHAWVSLERLEEVAQACLREGRLPIATYAERSRTPGLRRILAFQRGVILAFFRRLPLRQRNVRELQLGHHLFRDHEGHWQLRFVGDDLKIRTRKGVDNEYLVDLTTFAPSWIPILEEWINNYRPRLPEPKDPKDAQLLFRTKSGGRFTTLTLRLELASIVARYTNGVCWHPHVIRRVWATEFLAETGDVVTCAVVLGDTEQTVLREYNDVLKREHHVKAAKFNGEPSLSPLPTKAPHAQGVLRPQPPGSRMDASFNPRPAATTHHVRPGTPARRHAPRLSQGSGQIRAKGLSHAATF
jgi:hypothetical protein